MPDTAVIVNSFNLGKKGQLKKNCVNNVNPLRFRI
jgi:hypothetical protein